MRKNGINEINTNLLNVFLRKMIIVFLIIVSIIYICFTVVYMMYNVPLLRYLMLACSIQHIIWLILFLFFIKDMPLDMPLEPLILMYLAYISATIFPFTCMYWHGDHPVSFFWYMIVLVGAMAFNINNITPWIVLIALLVICVFLFSHIFPDIDLLPFIHYINIITIVSVFVLSAFFATMFVQMKKIKESVSVETLQKNDENPENYDALYRDIINHLETHKPFKDYHFNAQTLAKEIKTNVNYISKAISVGTNGVENFNTLINRFRIEHVKSLLNSNTMKKYTIDYIYAEAGYKYRSTFNAAFKNITGMTPSDYISQIN